MQLLAIKPLFFWSHLMSVSTVSVPVSSSLSVSRIKAIKERMNWLNENLNGCDWCCGGGDEEMEELREELYGPSWKAYNVKAPAFTIGDLLAS
jgi:hypothetical protein